MQRKNRAERLFEQFCSNANLEFVDVPESTATTVDYEMTVGKSRIAVEIESLERMSGWNPGGVYTRTVGEHVRRKIVAARKQIQSASRAGYPTILLVYNAVDPVQMFGTEQHDFIHAMYGELTVNIVGNRITDSYLGRNAMLRPRFNSSFSAVGHLRDWPAGPTVQLYENFHAKHPLPYGELQPYFELTRVVVEAP